MTPLRQKMIDAMLVRGFSPKTHKSYLFAANSLARYYHRSPDQISLEEIKAYFIYLVKERHLADASCRLHLNGLRFLYLQVLLWHGFDVPIPHPKRSQRIPELLTRQEVKQIIDACAGYKRQMMLLTCYGCGLRVSELIVLRVRDIDGERRLLRVAQGKGKKDRAVVLPRGLMTRLYQYWQRERPKHWLFPNANTPRMHLSVTTAQKTFQIAKEKTAIEKVGGIHSLRHAYATHQLEDGLPITELQRQLGHRSLSSTLRYLHWVPGCHTGKISVSDLVEQLGVQHD